MGAVATRARFPAIGGTYVLRLEAIQAGACRIGRLGWVNLPAGVFFYVGSALGPGGLRGRLGRHTRPLERRQWHVDHLRQLADVTAAWWLADGQRREHVWARALAAASWLEVPVPGFGASDCDCPAHLFQRTGAGRGAPMRALLADAAGVHADGIDYWQPPSTDGGCRIN